MPTASSRFNKVQSPNEHPPPGHCAEVVGLALLTVTLPFSAQALVVSGNSTALSNVVNLSVTTLGVLGVGATVGPVSSVSHSGSSPYADSDSALSAVLSILAVGPVSLNTGLLTVNASSNVDGTPGVHSASATSRVEGLNLTLDLLPLRTFTADTLVSTASVSGDYGSLVATGTTSLANAKLNGTVSVTATPAANTTIFNSGGLKIVLNEQLLSGDGISSKTMTVNGLHATFANYALNSIVSITGDITIGRSQASLFAIPTPVVTPVPEPATMSMFGAGAVGLLVAMRRRRSADSQA